MRPYKITFITISFLFLITIIKANDTIQTNQNQYFIDINKNLVLTNMDIGLVNSTYTKTKTHIFLNEVCEFLVPITTIETGLAYTIYMPSQNSSFVIYFTELPIICITTNFAIVDEPNVLASFKMIETNQNLLESFIGIQYRGGWTQSLKKKSMEIEFWTDSTGIETQNHSLLGMVNDDDWNLQAMYNEPLRIRSKTNNDLWRMVNTLHYQNQEPDAINGVRMKYVELFINSEYRGLYCLGEKVSRKQLKLKKHNGTIRGELYKGVSWGASTFTSVPPYNNNSMIWGGFEYKHPEEEVNWSNVHDLVNFVFNSSSQDFFYEYQNRFELDNLVDYFILLNLLRATDNTGKNVYIAKYTTNDNYFYVPWDLDGSFGTIWDGTNDNTTNDLLTNGFYNRLIYDCNSDGFRERLRNKWMELRSTIITHDSIMSVFNLNYIFLESNGLYNREKLAWPDYTHNYGDLTYLSDWITSRLAYLDIKFTENCIPLSINENDIKSKLVTIYPNPTNDFIYINSRVLNDYKVSVYNNLGQFVLQKIFNDDHENYISFENFKSGIYFIKFENNQHCETHKVILTD